jgi:hypothetical protein
MGRVEALEDLSVSTNIDLDHDDIMYPDVVTFLPIHVGCIAAIWSGATWQSIAICVVLYWLRMFAITAGYHRYFRIELTNKPGVSIRPCIPRAKHRSKKRAMVGRETSTSSFAFRYRTGCTFTQAQGLRVQSCRLDFLSTARRHRPCEGFRF